jgi:hypothetical protein
MCLETVKHRLETYAYDTFASWVNDVESIWLNAMASNPERSPLSLIALDLLQWFRKKLLKFGWDHTEAKLTRLIKPAMDLSDLAHHPPIHHR